MGHEKVARVRSTDWWVKANNMWLRTTSSGEEKWWQQDCWLIVQTLYAIYILTPERISRGHVQNRWRATFSWPVLYNIPHGVDVNWCFIIRCWTNLQ